jgi:alkanesulfonate monooxygenase SsuD/methylene tetrahydromethanopterin reductase-like flavin-dependent oxidoreductase (luciferase family)
VATGVEFGLSLSNRAVLFGLPPETLLQAAELAEQSELFDSVWVGDNLTSKPRLEAIVTLSGLATRTRRVKLGTICLASFPCRHPLILALQWASLDVLSGGRTILAVCIGGAANKGPEFGAEIEAMGVKSNERAPRMEEGIELLRKLWAPGTIDHEGQFYRIKDVELLPKPVQPRIPIVIAVNPTAEVKPHIQERAFRRVARLADGWQTDGTPPAVYKERWETIKSYAAEYGRADQMTHNSLHLMVNINEDAQAARDEAVAFLARYYGVGRVSEEKLASWLAYGPPSAVIEKLQQFIEAGCQTPVLRFTSFEPLPQLRRCIDEVLPAFK